MTQFAQLEILYFHFLGPLLLLEWLDPIALAARDLTTQEVEAVLRSENTEFPAGRIESKDIDLTIKLDKAYREVENYENLPLKRAKDGSIITLSDVSRIELGAESTRTLFKGRFLKFSTSL